LDEAVLKSGLAATSWAVVKLLWWVFAVVWLANRWLFPGILDSLPWFGHDPRNGSSPTASIGDAVSDGELTFVVNKFRCGQASLGSGTFAKKAQGEFCTARMTVTNTGEGAATLDSSDQKLYIGRSEYEASNLLSEEDSFFLEGINPGNKVSGFVAWDIPVDGIPDRLELHDSMFSSGVSVSIR
jgi:hypothetical protein